MKNAFVACWRRLKSRVRALESGQKSIAAMYGVLAGIVASSAVFLMVADILRGTGFELPSWISVLEQSQPPRSDEVRNYAVFTQVRYGAWTVVTGVQYTSSIDPEISQQWCYLDKPSEIDNQRVRLNLATISEGSSVTAADFRGDALAGFDLTQTQAQVLIQSHCRFQ